MKIICIIFCVIHSKTKEFSFKNINLDKEWSTHKSKYKLNFKSEEDRERKSIFIENYKFIENHNNKNNKFELEINKFSHLVNFILLREQVNINHAQK